MYDEKFMRRAIELSAQALDSARRAALRRRGREGRQDRRRRAEPVGEEFRSDLARRSRGGARRLPQPEDHGPVRRRALHLVRAVLGVRLHHDHGRHQPHVLRRIARPIRRGRAAPAAAAADHCWCAQQVGLPVDKRDMLPAETKLADEAIAVLKAWVAGAEVIAKVAASRPVISPPTCGEGLGARVLVRPPHDPHHDASRRPSRQGGR